MTSNLDPPSQPFATMHGAIRHWAAATPAAPALLADGKEPLTYGALLRMVQAIGADLAALGVGRGDRIAILHPGGADLAATVLGVWGHATAVPLNPHYTVAEFAMYLRDIGVKALLIARDMATDARLAAERIGLPVIDIVPGRGDLAGEVVFEGEPIGPPVPVTPAQPDDLVLLLTTSGTTSRSKIVPIRHRELVARCSFAGRRLGLRPTDRCLNLMPLYHSHGLNSGLGVSIVAGSSVIPMPDFNVDGFYKFLETMEPSWFTAVFTFHHQIHAHAAAHQETIARSRLRFIHTSSGRLEARIADDLESWFGVPMIGTYATTETGVITGDSHPPALRKRASVGTSAGADVAVLDASRSPVPTGARGEVCLRGPNVFSGYDDDPEATAAALSDGWFLTGDEGYLDADGFLFLTGRVRETINRGGEKVSPSEVDDAIRQHPAVSAAATFAIPHDTLGQEVAAAVVVSDGSTLTERDLTDFLRERLSGFKVPRRILLVDDIPTGSTGKVQRHTLAAAFGLEYAIVETRAATGTGDRDATPLEQQLQTLWGRTLNLPAVGLDDDFFMLGGDSLQAIELFLGIEETLDRRLPRSVLFEANTVAEMAKHIEASAPSRSLIPIQSAGSRPPFFCIHDLYGEVLNFRALAEHLGTDQPFYALQTIGLDGSEMPLSRIEDMAAQYLEEIRRIQPTGPYYLGGYSMGGLVAYEMAQQLRAAGETVDMLGLVDTYLRLGRNGETLSDWSMPVAHRPHGDATMPISEAPLKRFRWTLLMAQTVLWRRLFGLAWRGCEALGAGIPKVLRRPIAANLLAIRSYRIKPWDGDAVQFRGTPYSWDNYNVRDDWQRVIRGKLDILPISGLHHEILDEPHVGVLAEKLAAALDARRGRTTVPTPEPSLQADRN